MAGLNVFVAGDADDAGKLVGRARLADDVAEMRRLSNHLEAGNDIWRKWSQAVGGSLCEAGGDEFLVEVPASKLGDLPRVKEEYEGLVGATLSIGAGMKPSEASKALLAAKLTGKNRVTFYSPEVERIIAEAQKRQQDPQAKELDEALGKAAPAMHTGAGAGFSGASHPSTPSVAKPQASQGDHEEGEAMADLLGSDAQPAPPEATHAAADLERQLHEEAWRGEETDMHSDVQRRSRAQQVKAQLAQALQALREQAPLLEQAAQQAPGAYRAIVALTQACVATARELAGVQQANDQQAQMAKSEIGRPAGFPEDLENDLRLVGEEKKWHQAVTTPGATVRHDDYPWVGKVVRPAEDPVNGLGHRGMVLVEHPFTDEFGTHMPAAQRWYRALHLFPHEEAAPVLRPTFGKPAAKAEGLERSETRRVPFGGKPHHWTDSPESKSLYDYSHLLPDDLRNTYSVSVYRAPIGPERDGSYVHHTVAHVKKRRQGVSQRVWGRDLQHVGGFTGQPDGKVPFKTASDEPYMVSNLKDPGAFVSEAEEEAHRHEQPMRQALQEVMKRAVHVHDRGPEASRHLQEALAATKDPQNRKALETHLVDLDHMQSHGGASHPALAAQPLPEARYSKAEGGAEALPGGVPLEKKVAGKPEAQPPGKPNLELVHYSVKPGLKQVGVKHMGTGAPAQEYRQGRPEVPRAYYYEAGSQPEALVTQGAKAKYRAQLGPEHRIYDLGADPEGLHPKAKERFLSGEGLGSPQDTLLAMVRRRGYYGYKNSASQLPHVVALFHPHPVEPLELSETRRARTISDGRRIYDYSHMLPDDLRPHYGMRVVQETHSAFSRGASSYMTAHRLIPEDPENGSRGVATTFADFKVPPGWDKGPRLGGAFLVDRAHGPRLDMLTAKAMRVHQRHSNAQHYLQEAHRATQDPATKRALEVHMVDLDHMQEAGGASQPDLAANPLPERSFGKAEGAELGKAIPPRENTGGGDRYDYTHTLPNGGQENSLEHQRNVLEWSTGKHGVIQGQHSVYRPVKSPLNRPWGGSTTYHAVSNATYGVKIGPNWEWVGDQASEGHGHPFFRDLKGLVHSHVVARAQQAHEQETDPARKDRIAAALVDWDRRNPEGTLKAEGEPARSRHVLPESEPVEKAGRSQVVNPPGAFVERARPGAAGSIAAANSVKVAHGGDLAGKTSVKQVTAGQIRSQDPSGHPVSAREPNSK